MTRNPHMPSSVQNFFAAPRAMDHASLRGAVDPLQNRSSPRYVFPAASRFRIPEFADPCPFRNFRISMNIDGDRYVQVGQAVATGLNQRQVRAWSAMPPKAEVSYPTATHQERTRWQRPSRLIAGPLPSLSLDCDPPSPRPSARPHWRCISIAAEPTSASSKPKA